MAIVPKPIDEKIQYFLLHQPIWAAHFAALGLGATDSATLLTKVNAAKDARDAQQTLQNAAKSGKVTLDSAMDDLSRFGATLLAKIKTTAMTGGDAIFALADVPPPATPGPVAAPGAVTDFVATLGALGSLDLTWRSHNPSNASGTIYQLFRRNTPEGEFEYLGGAGDKKFTDSTIPAGSSQVTYQLQAVRSAAVGPWAQFNVNFGTGGTTATVTEIAPTKKAA